MAAAALKPLTVEDLARELARRPDARLELIEGSISENEAPVYEHGDAQFGLGHPLRGSFHRRGPRDDGTGGWWIVPEVDIQLNDHNIVRPDIAGWRRDRHPSPPTNQWPVRARPDWVCEIVSPGSVRRDQVVKRRLYAESGVEWYWLVHLAGQFIEVLHLQNGSYTIAADALPIPDARLPPFDAVAIDLRPAFGIEEE